MGWTTKEFGFNSRQERDISVFSTAVRRVLGFTQFSAPCVMGTLSVGMSGQGVILTTRLHAVARLKICGARLLLGIIFRVIMPN
jgi:hypothetical protein